MALKYRNRRTNGYASRKEADLAVKLHALAKSGVIHNLQEQVPFVVLDKQEGERAVKYVADFVYTDSAGQKVVMDAKGFRTPVYKLKAKLFRAKYGFPITEV